MKPALVTLLLAAAVGARPLGAQTWVGADAALVTHRESGPARTSRGGGAGLFAESVKGRWRVQVSGLRARMSDSTAFDLTQADARLGYRIRGIIFMELGMGRQWVAPSFGRDVTLVSVGASANTNLSKRGASAIWLRAAFIPLAGFRGGGSSGSSVEIGLGGSISPEPRRWRASVEFGLQRLDRQVQGTAVPIQTSFARLGVAMGFRRDKLCDKSCRDNTLRKTRESA